MNLSLKEIPQSVSVITSKRMEDQQLNNLIDVMKNTTGVWATSQAGNTGWTEFYSRGYQIKNFQVDGAKSSFFDTDKTGLENIDTALYDSVSVVRGATGLLTGAGDPSGSINLVRKKPTKEFQATLETQAGRWDKYRGVVDIGGGFNEDDSIRGRFIALHNQGGFWHPLLDRQNNTLYGVIEADLGDSTTISGSWERTETKHNGSAHSISPSQFVYDENYKVHLSNFDKYTWIRPEWSRYKQVRDNYTLDLDHHINDSWKIDATYNYTEDDIEIKDARCRTYFRTDGTCTGTPYWGSPIEYLTKSHSFDVKLNSNFELWGQTHDLVVGFNGEKSKLNSKYYPKIGSLQDMGIINNKWVIIEPEFGNAIPYYDTRNEQYGGFISTKLNFTDDLSAILGGRYSKWKTKTIRDGVIVADDRKFDNFLPYLALSYNITDNLTTYASYTEIFNPQNYKDRSGKYLDPETGFNYEVGLKGEWFDGRLNSSIALFQSGKDGLAVLDKDENGNCYILPDGNCAWKAEDDTKNKGWEFEVAGEITPYWHAQFGFSSSILKDKNGKRLNSTLTPIRVANLFTTYQATPSLTVGGGLRWQSEIYDDFVKNTYIGMGREDLVGEAKQDDFFVVDLMANYEFNKNLSLLVNINNALNKEYKTTFGTYSYGEERNWMATLKYKF
ncbi:TonB-dependent receptor [Arcobacter sp. FW59]|nr:TonB-dependent receptor [Arcobacter sp. FW59]